MEKTFYDRLRAYWLNNKLVATAVFAAVTLVGAIKAFETIGEFLKSEPSDLARACTRGGQLPSSLIDQALALNATGNQVRGGDPHRAITCYRAALERSPVWFFHTNIGDVQMELGELAAAEISARTAIDMVRRQMSSFVREVSQRDDRRQRMIGGAGCALRSQITEEDFSIKPWLLLEQVKLRSGDLDAAIAAMDEVIDLYPPESCMHLAATVDALYERALLHCIGGRTAVAAEDFEAGLARLPLDAGGTREIQEMLRDQSRYVGRIDGQFGPATRAAFLGWVRDGCPGNARDEIRSLLAN